jgi:SPP1 gp7 family putative phage head morphogenesis protein
MAWDAPFNPVDFEEAIAWFREKVPMTREEAAALESQVRARAFWISHISEADLINDIMLAIDKALAEGTTLAEFQNDVAGELMARWLDDERVTDPVYRMETIFRTNIQSAYAAGRYQQQTNPAVLRARPFWLYDALIDGRTSTVCRNLNGTLLPADDAWWDSRYPPNHFNCRSGVRSLTEAEANARGITENPTTQTPDAGWRERPTFAPPATKEYHPSIAESVQDKIESTESES